MKELIEISDLYSINGGSTKAAQATLIAGGALLITLCPVGVAVGTATASALGIGGATSLLAGFTL